MSQTNQLRRTIFAGCKELGLDDDARRDVIHSTTGATSLSGMSETDMRKVVKALEASGFRKSKGKKFKRAPRGDLAYVHVLWGLLRKAGKLDRPDRSGLNAFIRARFGDTWGAVPLDVDDLTDTKKITAVIRALEAMCDRNSVDRKRLRQ